MNPTFEEIVGRVAGFERDAHVLFAAFESAPSRVISITETRRQIGILNLKQTELLEEAVRWIEHGLY